MPSGLRIRTATIPGVRGFSVSKELAGARPPGFISVKDID
jgi:hypothetical protein